MSTTRVPPYRVVTSTVPAGCSRTSPMIGGLLPAGRVAAALERRVGIFRRDHGEKLAFVGDVQGIEPEQFAGAPHRVAHGNRFLRTDERPARSREPVR